MQLHLLHRALSSANQGLCGAVMVLTCRPWFHFLLSPNAPQIQGQRVQLAKLEAERSAMSRLDKIRSDQGARATALEREAAASELRANLIEYNLEAVDAALDAVNAGEGGRLQLKWCKCVSPSVWFGLFCAAVDSPFPVKACQGGPDLLHHGLTAVLDSRQIVGHEAVGVYVAGDA